MKNAPRACSASANSRRVNPSPTPCDTMARSNRSVLTSSAGRMVMLWDRNS
ncbi:Uncharacterised protein [Bordetella pertussis]|nr:Uncharacterised protein [Bordetella pertussis]